MKILFAAGGTAGHINPALAIADKLKETQKNCEILFVGNESGMENRLVKQAGYKFAPIKVKGFYRSFSPSAIIHNISAATLSVTSQFQSKKILKEWKPDICIGTGGYVSGPIMLQAAKAGIKTVIHEQNAYPGITTKILAKSVDRVLCGTKRGAEIIDMPQKIAVVGNPVNAKILTTKREDARRALSLDEKDIFILSFGGSLGAYPISKEVLSMLTKLHRDENVKFCHATGRGDYQKFIEEMKNCDIKDTGNITIREYIDNMEIVLLAADLVICRAGAMTLSELTAAGKASILIPSPYVAENHQYHNAKALADIGASILIEQKDLDGSILAREVEALIDDPTKLASMGENAKKESVLYSVDLIVDEIMKTIK